MTLKHVAWLKFKGGVSAEKIERHLEACHGLVAKVPSLDNLECGPNTTDRAGGFTHGIIVTVADRAALDAYLKHPAHVPVADALVADVAEIRVMDIEV
ncbi:MAG: Dabb family protein [Anaerolineales bacterium]